MRYRLLIFDFDGTLADSFSLFLEHMRQTVEYFGLRRIDPASVDELRSCGAKEVMSYLGLPRWKVPLVAAYFRRLMAADAARTPLFPGVEDLLLELAQSGVVLAMVSSNSEANVRAVLGPESASLIRVYECGASLFGKAAKFRKVLQQTGVPASQTLAIGDEIRDLEAAISAQLDFAAVSWGYTKVDSLRALSPKFVFTQLQEIADLVKPCPNTAGGKFCGGEIDQPSRR